MLHCDGYIEHLNSLKIERKSAKIPKKFGVSNLNPVIIWLQNKL